MTTPDSLVETLAAQWDGCEYDTPGGLIDIGDAIRRAGLPLAAILRAEAERLAAQSAPDLDTMRTDFHQWCATNGYKTGFVNGGECPMGRPVYEDHRTHAAWWAFQKAAKLYGAQSAPTAAQVEPSARAAPGGCMTDAVEIPVEAVIERLSFLADNDEHGSAIARQTLKRAAELLDFYHIMALPEAGVDDELRALGIDPDKAGERAGQAIQSAIDAELRGASRPHGEASLSNDVLGADAPERN